eukprot:2860483-Prymnesium_polylepis.1
MDKTGALGVPGLRAEAHRSQRLPRLALLLVAVACAPHPSRRRRRAAASITARTLRSTRCSTTSSARGTRRGR